MDLEKIVAFIRSKPFGRIWLHVALWSVYYLAILYLTSISIEGHQEFNLFLSPLRHITVTALFFYPMMYWIIPRFLARGKYIPGISLTFFLIIIYTVLDHLLERSVFLLCDTCLLQFKISEPALFRLFEKGMLQVVIVRLVTLGIIYQLFLLLAFPIGIKLIFAYFEQRVNTLRLQQENTQLEFNFLKAQVNPHFLFNTLSNIYGLILSDKKEASAETVAKLATFMRYTLYESNATTRPVKREIELLQAYISLEKIRQNDVVVNFTTQLDDQEYELPPLLFMPVVENAFKYCSRSKNQDPYIFLNLSIENAQLSFRIANTYNAQLRVVHDQGGIGLENLRKRITHSYPGNLSQIDIIQEDELFLVTVILNLNR